MTPLDFLSVSPIELMEYVMHSNMSATKPNTTTITFEFNTQQKQQPSTKQASFYFRCIPKPMPVDDFLHDSVIGQTEPIKYETEDVSNIIPMMFRVISLPKLRKSDHILRTAFDIPYAFKMDSCERS
jgi:hypothetical protein